MNAPSENVYEVDISDVEYLRHGDRPLLARVYRPRGTGPFPLIIDLHGGAWTRKDRTTDAAMNEQMARAGIAVAALDFRMPPWAAYPASLQDINYAVRWFKQHAAEYGSRPERVGILGVSSGGHQAMLTALRPHDPRYAALPLAGGMDATVRCVVLCWAVIDPLGRYRYAKPQTGTKLYDQVVPAHEQYWPDEAAMEEGNPTMALERGEQTPLPPVGYIQGLADEAHPLPHVDRFVAAYRKAGGHVELNTFEGVGEAFITTDPTSATAQAAIAKIIEFVRRVG